MGAYITLLLKATLLMFISVVIVGIGCSSQTLPTPSTQISSSNGQDIITFADPNLEKIIRTEDVIMGKKAITAQYISKADLESIRHLRGSGEYINDIAGLQYCINLEQLYLHYNDISDISALANLTNLEILILDYNNISDISALGNLNGLRRLGLFSNSVNDISVLAELRGLRDLELGRNDITDISALSNLTNLQFIELSENRISDISALVKNQGISAGDTLDLSPNPLNHEAYNKHIPRLQIRGVRVLYSEPENPIELTTDIGNMGIEIIDAYCTYSSSCQHQFPFRFTLKNLNAEDIDVSYRWTLNDPEADAPRYQGSGNTSLVANEKKEIEIDVNFEQPYNPCFLVMYVYVYCDDDLAAFYRGQKSTYGWDYSVTPPIKREPKPSD